MRKLVRSVLQVTCGGSEAKRRGHHVPYVTERATFALVPEDVALAEVAPGVDVRRDVLERMGFLPMLNELRSYPESSCAFRLRRTATCP